MSAASPILSSIVVLAVFALILGGVSLIVRPGDRLRGTLMIVAAFVLLGNLLLWSWPLPPAR
jgi:hypothetical protein